MGRIFIRGERQISGINIKKPIKNTLAKQNNVVTFLDGIKKTIADGVIKPASKIRSRQLMSKLKPVEFKLGPSKDGSPPGRLFKFQEHFEREGIDFDTDIHTMSHALAILTSRSVDEQGIHHSCSCNGPHHALIVAKFSYMVVGEMLTHSEMSSKINKIIEGLGSEAKGFLTKNNYSNYKKIIEMMALLHDTGRPSDGIDAWDKSNEINVITNIEYLLKTAHLSEQAIANIMTEVKSGIKNKDNLKLSDDNGFLFGAPLGAGDSLHSGHAFHGGIWDCYSYNPSYVRLYTQYPSFNSNFMAIVKEVRAFIPEPTAKNGGKLAAVKKYLNWNECDGDGISIIKPDFSDIIHTEFSSLDPEQFPIMAKHFSLEDSLIQQKNNDFQRNKANIQNDFNNALDSLKNNLYSGEENTNSAIISKLYEDLGNAQKQFFEALTLDSIQGQDMLITAITAFRKSCKENIEIADKIMGHGWLYRIAEVLIKAVVGLFAGIGMILGSVVCQGLAKSEHRQKFANTFFTLNQTQASLDLDSFKQEILGDEKEKLGLLDSSKFECLGSVNF